VTQTVDELARVIVTGVEQMIDLAAAPEVPSSREVFLGRDFSVTDGIWRDLHTRGFGEVVTYEMAALASKPIADRLPSEFALSADHTLVATVSTVARPAPATSLSMLTLLSGTERGQIVTSTGPATGLPTPLGTALVHLPEDTSTTAVLATHHNLIARGSEQLQHFRDQEAFLVWHTEHLHAAQQYWIGLGMSVFRHFVEAKFPAASARLGAQCLDSILAHPQWYKYAKGAE
jgi:hypothetical protein